MSDVESLRLFCCPVTEVFCIERHFSKELLLRTAVTSLWFCLLCSKNGRMSGVIKRPLRNKNGEDKKIKEHTGQLSLPIKDQDRSSFTPEWHCSKESSVAVVLPQKPEEQKQTVELITSTEDDVDIIKVHLKSRSETKQSLRMLTDEVSQIQEVRYCLKTLREQMAARQNGHNKHPADVKVNQPSVSNHHHDLPDPHLGDSREESVKLREATRHLYAQLKEMEKRHQEERDRLEADSHACRISLAEQSKRLEEVEQQAEEKTQQVEELKRQVGSAEIENSVLKEKMAAAETELLQLKEREEEEDTAEERCAELEEELALLRKKNHQFDDMLKSQQRKIRLMIEQLQNSRTVLQERDRAVLDLEERVAFMQAENKELRDHMEYLLAGQDPPPSSVENKPEIVYSKPLKPTSPTNKALPFIKVIEIKS
nr:tuftelin 1b [Nothobranchius furzeri]